MSKRAVCYAPEKRKEIHAFAVAKTPVKIQNFKQPDQSNELILTKFTSVTPLPENVLTFPFSEELAASFNGEPVNLSAIHNLTAEQLISVKGHVSSIAGVKLVQTKFGGKVKKQDVIIRDTTACVKLVLWGQHTDSLVVDETYVFKNLRIKATKYERYLNTPCSDEFTATQCLPFTTPLVPAEQDVSTAATISGTILGVQKNTKSLCCVSCHRRAITISGDMGVCQSCELSQLPESCEINWVVKLLIKPDNSPRNVRLTLPHDILEKFLQLTHASADLATVTDAELVLSIMRNSSFMVFNIIYDTIDYQVTSIELSEGEV